MTLTHPGERMHSPEFPQEPQFRFGVSQDLAKGDERYILGPPTVNINVFGVMDGTTGLPGTDSLPRDARGGVAAKLAKDEITTYIQKHLDDRSLSQEGAGTDLLKDSFDAAHILIREQTMGEDDDIEGGTTSASVILAHNLTGGRPGFSWAAVGDVEIDVYNTLDGSFENITTPESEGNLVWNALGGWTYAGVEGLPSEAVGLRQTGTRSLRQGDVLIIASDAGDNLSAQEIMTIIDESETPGQATPRLVDASRAKLGKDEARDDLTFMVLQLNENAV